MSKTVDDLVKVFDEAHWSAHSRRAGIAAVVRAVRDEMHAHPGECWACEDNRNKFNEILGDAGEKVAGSANTVDAQQCQTTTISVTDPYEPITGVTDYHRGKTVGERLITAAKEAVAIARGEKEPAREYAPVCVWTRADKSKLLNVQWWSVGCVSGLKREGHHSPCSSCGKPIRFVEAKP